MEALRVLLPLLLCEQPMIVSKLSYGLTIIIKQTFTMLSGVSQSLACFGVTHSSSVALCLQP